MSNTGYLFLILIGLPVFLALIFLLPARWQKMCIIVGSFFYYIIYSNLNYYALIFFTASILLNYPAVKLLEKVKKPRLTAGILIFVNLIPLVFVKVTGASAPGISFYTFSLIALIVDSLHNVDKYSLTDHVTFLGMFPKFMIGPIARYDEISPALEMAENERICNGRRLEEGIKTFIIGLGMKVLLADQLATAWTGICVSGTKGITCLTAWLGAIIYTMELYFDFWGCSLIAIGLGCMIGFDIPANFNDPYSSTSVSEFWRRWHITLGTWFRDYIYIPLGGSRCSKIKTVFNLSVVWIATGLWHGMDWNFLIWGCVLGMLVILEKMTPLGKIAKAGIAGHIYILILMPVTWMIFAHSDLKSMYEYLMCMFGVYPSGAKPAAGQFMRYIEDYWYFLVAGILLLLPKTREIYQKLSEKKISAVIYLAIFWVAVYVLYAGASQPFMYAAF